MTCEWVRLPNGTTAVVLLGGAKPKAKPCIGCGRASTRLCDAEVGDGKTCDAPLCTRCSTSRGRGEIDYCAQHAALAPTVSL